MVQIQSPFLKTLGNVCYGVERCLKSMTKGERAILTVKGGSYWSPTGSKGLLKLSGASGESTLELFLPSDADLTFEIQLLDFQKVE
jgi:FKBP-type peptidyl-prolyl cis-trans isomerase